MDSAAFHPAIEFPSQQPALVNGLDASFANAGAATSSNYRPHPVGSHTSAAAEPEPVAPPSNERQLPASEDDYSDADWEFVLERTTRLRAEAAARKSAERQAHLDGARETAETAFRTFLREKSVSDWETIAFWPPARATMDPPQINILPGPQADERRQTLPAHESQVTAAPCPAPRPQSAVTLALLSAANRSAPQAGDSRVEDLPPSPIFNALYPARQFSAASRATSVQPSSSLSVQLQHSYPYTPRSASEAPPSQPTPNVNSRRLVPPYPSANLGARNPSHRAARRTSTAPPSTPATLSFSGLFFALPLDIRSPEVTRKMIFDTLEDVNFASLKQKGVVILISDDAATVFERLKPSLKACDPQSDNLLWFYNNNKSNQDRLLTLQPIPLPQGDSAPSGKLLAEMLVGFPRASLFVISTSLTASRSLSALGVHPLALKFAQNLFRVEILARGSAHLGRGRVWDPDTFAERFFSRGLLDVGDMWYQEVVPFDCRGKASGYDDHGPLRGKKRVLRPAAAGRGKGKRKADESDDDHGDEWDSDEEKAHDAEDERSRMLVDDSDAEQDAERPVLLSPSHGVEQEEVIMGEVEDQMDKEETDPLLQPEQPALVGVKCDHCRGNHPPLDALLASSPLAAYYNTVAATTLQEQGFSAAMGYRAALCNIRLAYEARDSLSARWKELAPLLAFEHAEDVVKRLALPGSSPSPFIAMFAQTARMRRDHRKDKLQELSRPGYLGEHGRGILAETITAVLPTPLPHGTRGASAQLGARMQTGAEQLLQAQDPGGTLRRLQWDATDIINTLLVPELAVVILQELHAIDSAEARGLLASTRVMGRAAGDGVEKVLKGIRR